MPNFTRAFVWLLRAFPYLAIPAAVIVVSLIVIVLAIMDAE